MKLLLDSHTFLWAVMEPERLSLRAQELIASAHNQVFVSTASLWEISIKAALQKIKLDGPPRLLVDLVTKHQFTELPILSRHAVSVFDLPHYHRDPFDRLLVAVCLIEGLALVSADTNIAKYDIQVIW
jgi:PIN domain nuclease of toxin-antitoxin system